MPQRTETRPVRLETATPEDAPRLTVVASLAFFDDRKRMPEDVRATIEGAEDPSKGPPHTSYAWQHRVIARINSDDTRSTYYKVILGDDRIVGGLLVIERTDLGEGEWRCEGIYVDPDYQNRGIGKAIIRQMFRLHPDAVRWSLDTPDYATSNHRFYERMGFTYFGTSNGDSSVPFAFYDFENCLPQEERLAL
jgi:RimJ/RimL family protein N-acetyltransferase